MPNKGTTGTSFITSLVCRGPRRGIEPGTSLEASTLPLGYRGGGPCRGIEPGTSLEASTLPLGYREGGYTRMYLSRLF